MLREKNGLSQKVLAIDLKVSQPTISDWESGRKLMSNASALRVADYFNVSMDFLLGRSDDDTMTTKKEPAVSDDELRSVIVNRIQSLSDPALIRVGDFLDGLEAGQAIGAAAAAAPDPDGGPSPQ